VKATTALDDGGPALLVALFSGEHWHVTAFVPGDDHIFLNADFDATEAPTLIAPHEDGDDWWPLGVRVAGAGVTNYDFNGLGLVESDPD
jgi:hypothetical protein